MSLCLRGGGGLMRGIKIPQQDFALKMQGGGLMREGGAYLRDITVYCVIFVIQIQMLVRVCSG